MTDAAEGDITVEAIARRLTRDGSGDFMGDQEEQLRGLATALDAIGWRSAGGAESEEVAEELGWILRDAVGGHRDIATVITQIAEMLRGAAAPLDGSRPSVREFHPAAEELLRRYLRD